MCWVLGGHDEPRAVGDPETRRTPSAEAVGSDCSGGYGHRGPRSGLGRARLGKGLIQLFSDHEDGYTPGSNLARLVTLGAGGFGAALRASRLPPLRGVRRLDVRVGWWGCTDERPRPLLASAMEVAAGSLGELRRLDGAEP
ncbi:MAG: hypothetical protein ACI8PZ_007548, partial [Myxococcota bacterium]